MKMILSIVLASVLALSGCESFGGYKTDAQKISVACASAAASLKVLTVANFERKLSENSQKEISAAVDLIRPVCSADHAPNLSDVQAAAFEAALDLIADHATKVGG